VVGEEPGEDVVGSARVGASGVRAGLQEVLAYLAE
jgi:hypothetical protein